MSQNTPGSSIRPVTSKARGVCKYFTTARGCFAGDNCKFLHAVPKPEVETKENDQPHLTPYDKAKRCRYFDQGFCKRGENCWFVHKLDKARVIKDEDDDENCSICFEKPATYGLLDGCSHIFCLSCIKQWRDPQNKPDNVTESGNIKKCPMCRTSSRFIIPSSNFRKEGTEDKKKLTEAYKGSMGRVQCRYFQKSLQKNKKDPICPYGKDCFYSHINEDGTLYTFKDGVDVCMKKYRRKTRRGPSLNFVPMEQILQRAFTFAIDRGDFSELDPHAISTNGTPTIHQQHNSDRNGDEDDDHREWLRIQEARLRSLADTNSAGLLAMELLRVGWQLSGTGSTNRGRDDVGQSSDGQETELSEEEQENEVMERLQMMADEVLNAFGSPPIRSPAARRTVDESDDDSASDMPGLECLTSDSEDDESDEDDETSEGDAELTMDTNSGFGEPSEERTVPGHDPRLSARTSDVIGVRTSADEEESDDMPGLISIVPSDSQSKRQDTTIPPPAAASVLSITESGKASGSNQPLTAFTTDGRGRVVSVGDPTDPASENAQSASGQPELSAESGTSSRRGILGWIGSLL